MPRFPVVWTNSFRSSPIPPIPKNHYKRKSARLQLISRVNIGFFHRLIMGIMEADSTVVYYEVDSGIKEPSEELLKEADGANLELL